MYTEVYNLWENMPESLGETPTIEYYKPKEKTTDFAVVIFPGGGYCMRAEHEGAGYAEFLAEHGITAFVVQYRVSPCVFPLPLLDARRAVQFVRHNAQRFDVDKNKIAVMGSSAGGHLAALVSTYFDNVEYEKNDEVDNECFVPNAQILCYPVINLYDKNIANIGSGNNLIGDDIKDVNACQRRERISPNMLVTKDTPQAFIWHTFEDPIVNVRNSLEYAVQLREFKVPTEMHIFPHGDHGLGLTTKSNSTEMHISIWGELLVKWLLYIEW